MKKSLFLLLFTLFVSSAFSQNASDYFPANTGYRWYYKNITLDSNNNPVAGSDTYRKDSFALVQNYQGLSASTIYSKNNLTSFSQQALLTDTLRYNFQGSNAWSYLSVLSAIDTISFLQQVGIINFIRNLQTWYSTYRFAGTVNSSYTIFTKDTTFHIDTLTLPIRVAMTGKRLSDQTISTVNGSYNCKRFIMDFKLSYLLTVPPIPPIPITILDVPDSLWFAQDVWMTKEVIPSSGINLTPVGIPLSFTIPGRSTELTTPSVGIINYTNEVPAGYRLEQNYPNPFNPETIINFQLPQAGNIKLAVYNSAGMNVSTLVDQKLSPGSYNVSFNGAGLSSGIYFYTLETKDFTETKKMILIK